MSHHRTIYVIDHDLDSRRILSAHLSSIGAEAWPFGCGPDLLAMLDHLGPACILLDMDCQAPSGIEMLAELRRSRHRWPVIAMSMTQDVAVAVEAMKLGALDFLQKPVSAAALSAALAPAWDVLDRSIEKSESRRLARDKMARLTPREVDIVLGLLAGQPNKAVAHDLGISVRTVEMHRSHILAKLGVRNLAEAAVLATLAGVVTPAGADWPDRTRARDPAIRFSGRPLPADARPTPFTRTLG